MYAGLDKTLAAALLTACAAVAAPAAHAIARADTVVVTHRDLDLARPAGLATFERRLRAAARLVCGAPEREEVGAFFARRACYRSAIAAAKRDAGIGQQQVAAVL